MDYTNLTMLTDFYQLTMMQGYFSTGIYNRKTAFDVFFRSNPMSGGYSIFCGLEQVVKYIEKLHFSDDDIEYLRVQNCFSEDFLEYLKGFKFTGDIYAFPEGSVIFPKEPIFRVEAPIIEAQFIETAILNMLNHQSLIATKASRIVWAAEGNAILEFGLRRAQGPDAGIYGARAAVIGGCVATSNVLAGQMFDMPIRGTHAHSWVMSFDDEITAFREYVKLFPQASILLVDTYDTINSGVPNAIKVFTEMREAGIPLTTYGIRLDSGDLAFLSKVARNMLDEAGFEDALISASCDLDEYLIRDLKLQGSAVTLWGVGANLITSKDCPAFGCVYKLAAIEGIDGRLHPTIKLSDNTDKVTNPGIKKVVRLYDKTSGKIKVDLIMLGDEKVDETKDLTVFDPVATWIKMTLKANEFIAREMLVPVFKNGVSVYEHRTVPEIKLYCKNELNTLWDEHRRLFNPQIIPVDLSDKLWVLKNDMIDEIRG